jgi:hypothetical protein
LLCRSQARRTWSGREQTTVSVEELEEARLIGWIGSLEENIEHWKRELAIETPPECRKLFIDNIRSDEEQIVWYQERLQKLQEGPGRHA